jgi:RNA polymerase sigma factor (sigma-70 family)
MAQDPDLESVRALQAGDDAALGELMARHKEPLFRFLCRYTQNETVARDLAQEAFVRAYFKINSFTPQAKFATWLFQIGLNLVRDFARSKHAKREPLHASWELAANEPEIAKHNDPGSRVDRTEQLAQARVAIDRLPEELKTALILTVFEERSQQEAAELLGTTPKAIEARVYRARKALRETLFRSL